MIIRGICRSEFNVSQDEFIKQDKKHIFITVLDEEKKKIIQHWGTYKPPIVFDRIIVNTKTAVMLDIWHDFHCKLIKYHGIYQNKKYTNFKLKLVKVS